VRFRDCRGPGLLGNLETGRRHQRRRARRVDSENGTITLAPALTLVYDTKEAYIWSSATDATGNIYLGTGHEGRIFKVTPTGEGRLLYDAAELDVTALVTDPQGNLYAGTSPEGKVYKITPDGKESVFYDPPDKYIWSLAFDAATSTLYAGTGDKGVIYKIDSAGKSAVLVDTNETNIVSLALDKNGNLLAGTDPSGLLLRVSANGKLFAMLRMPAIRRSVRTEDWDHPACWESRTLRRAYRSRTRAKEGRTDPCGQQIAILVESERYDVGLVRVHEHRGLARGVDLVNHAFVASARV